MENAVAAAAAVETKEAVSAEDVATFLNRFRESVGLEPKASYESNFVFDSPALECVHVLRIEFDDIFMELDRAGESREAGRLVGA